MTTTLATRQGQELAHYLQEQIGEIAAACPQHLTPERMLAVASICLYRNPELLECDPASIKTSVIQAATLDLDLTPVAGEAYLIPRWNKKAGVKECQLQPGYKGLAKHAREAANLNYIQAELVRAKDHFECWRDPDWHIVHRPVFGIAGGPVTHVYAVAKLPTGEYQICVMTRDEVEEIRKRSQYPDSGPWASDWGEMAKKTAVKRLVKLLPTRANPVAANRLVQAIELDNREYEEGPREHHAIHHDNQTGHGSGAYAPPETVSDYGSWVKCLVEELNTKWADRHASDPRGVPNEIMSTWQMSGHLLKWARSQGLVNAPDEIRAGQRDKFAAVAWSREPQVFEDEARRYGREKWREAMDKLKAQQSAEKTEDEILDEIAASEGKGDAWEGSES